MSDKVWLARSVGWEEFLADWRKNRFHVSDVQRAFADMDPAARRRRLTDLGVDEVEALLEHSFLSGDTVYRDQVVERLCEINPERGAGPRKAAAERDKTQRATSEIWDRDGPTTQYLTYDDEMRWSVMTAREIKEAIEEGGQQAVPNRPSMFWALDRNGVGDGVTTPLILQRVDIPTADNWIDSYYELHDQFGATRTQFTIRTDGKS